MSVQTPPVEPSVTVDVLDESLDPRRRRRRGRAMAVGRGLTVIGLLVGLILGAVPIVAELIQTVGTTSGPVTLVASVLLTMGGYALVGYLYVRRYLPGRVGVALPSGYDLGWVAGTTLGALTFVLVASFALTTFGIDAVPNSVGVVGETPRGCSSGWPSSPSSPSDPQKNCRSGGPSRAASARRSVPPSPSWARVSSSPASTPSPSSGRPVLRSSPSHSSSSSRSSSAWPTRGPGTSSSRCSSTASTTPCY